MFHIVFVCVLLFVVTVRGCDLILDNPSNEVTVSEDDMTFKWKVNNVDNTIDILLHSSGLVGGSSASWFAFGLSEAGGMLGADIVSVEFGSSGSVSVVDRYVPWVAFPLEQPPRPYPVADTQQDWELVCGESLENSVTAVVRRKWNTTDEEQDRDFVSGSVSVIYAWGDGALGYHGSNRGSIKVDFFGNSPSSVDDFVPPADADASFVEGFSPGFELRERETQYICQIRDVGTTPRHIVAVEQVYYEQDYGPYVHHVLVHACGNDLDAVKDMDLYDDKPFPCQKNNIDKQGTSPSGTDACFSVIYGGAVGGDPFVLPEDAGVLIGTDIRYIVVEAHIDNLNLDSGVLITDIIRVHTTSTLRTHNAGSMVVGDPAVFLPTIPQGQSDAHYETTCPMDCTNTFTTDRYIFSSFVHMHQVGKTIWTSLLKYDENVLISKHTYDYREFWNFGFQELTPVNVTLSPGDEINTHCIYDTTKNDEDVEFGSDSSEEMCMSFLFYYPYYPNEPYFCGYVTPYGSICGQFGTPNFNIFSGANPKPDGDTSLPEDLFVSYTGDDDGDISSSDNDEGVNMTNNFVIIIVVAGVVVLSVAIAGALFFRRQNTINSGKLERLDTRDCVSKEVTPSAPQVELSIVGVEYSDSKDI